MSELWLLIRERMICLRVRNQLCELYPQKCEALYRVELCEISVLIYQHFN